MSGPRDLSAITFFVSSTYVDLREHRAAAIARIRSASGMICAQEFFGSRDQKPLKTCLEEVEKSDVFLLFVAHRYGSIDTESGKSFTEREYEHAKKHDKLVLAYLIDDDYSWPPRNIDHGDNYEHLKAFKVELRKELTVDAFTTADDLAAKVLQDLLRELPRHGFKIGDKPCADDTPDLADLLGRFVAMPKLYLGREFNLEATLGSFKAASAQACEALGLTEGASLSRPISPTDPALGKLLVGDLGLVHASDSSTLAFSELPSNSPVTLKLKTDYGTYEHTRYRKRLEYMPQPSLGSAVFYTDNRIVVEDKETERRRMKGLVFVSLVGGGSQKAEADSK